MTDEKIIKEPVADATGAVEPPVQPPSDNTTEPSAVDEESLKVILGPMIEDALSKQAQSVKDKRIAKQESRITSLEDTLAQFKELQDEGMSEKQALQHMKVDEFLSSQGQAITDVPPEKGPAVQTSVAADEGLSAILNITGLTDNEPDVVEILRKEQPFQAKVIALNSLAESRKQAPKPAAVGNVLPSGTGGPVPAEETLETITEQLAAEMAEPKKDFQKIKELRKKHDELLPKE